MFCFSVPLDSVQLTEALHSRGINMRYLSYICTLCRIQKSKHSPDNPNEDSIIASLELLERVLTVEMISRHGMLLYLPISTNILPFACN